MPMFRINGTRTTVDSIEAVVEAETLAEAIEQARACPEALEWEVQRDGDEPQYDVVDGEAEDEGEESKDEDR